MSTSLPPLEILLKAIKSGSCKFIQLTPEKRDEEHNKYLKKIEKGEVVLRQRKPRSDKGKRHRGQEVLDCYDSTYHYVYFFSFSFPFLVTWLLFSHMTLTTFY